MTAIRAHFDGRWIVPDEPVALPVHEPLTVYVEPARNGAQGTAADLANSGLFGIWRTRTNIGDSLQYARDLRQEAETRHHEIDDPAGH
jgi:hypothetical protein